MTEDDAKKLLNVKDAVTLVYKNGLKRKATITAVYVGCFYFEADKEQYADEMHIAEEHGPVWGSYYWTRYNERIASVEETEP